MGKGSSASFQVSYDRTSAVLRLYGKDCYEEYKQAVKEGDLSGFSDRIEILPATVTPDGYMCSARGKATLKELPDAIKKFYKGKLLLPNGFFTDSKIGKAQGVYVPFWLFGCHLHGAMDFNAQTVRTYRQGDYQCTETSHFLLKRAGEMDFKNVPVDASVKMRNDLMDSIEPFDFSGLVNFDGAYLSGYVADRFDSTPDSELERAENRMLNSAADEIRSTTGYGAVTVRSNNLRADNAKVRYALLPVYLLNCEYGGKKYQYAINGQTGKVVGELPESKVKKLAFFLGSFVVFGLLAFLITYFMQ